MCRFSTADHIVIRSIRTWGWDRVAWRSVEEQLGNTLGVEDGQSLTRNLFGLYCLIDRSATRKFLLPPIECRRVSEDEQLLIGALAEAQQNDWPLAVVFLEDFLPQDCVRYAFQSISTTADTLVRAGYAFTPQPGLLLNEALDPYRQGLSAPAAIVSH